MHTFPCPHCGGYIQVQKNQINCKIFRHGVKKNMTQIPPHSTKAQCDAYLKSGNVYGCCKPFLFDGTNAVATDIYN
jgi:hypothetical protein